MLSMRSCGYALVNGWELDRQHEVKGVRRPRKMREEDLEHKLACSCLYTVLSMPRAI